MLAGFQGLTSRLNLLGKPLLVLAGLLGVRLHVGTHELAHKLAAIALLQAGDLIERLFKRCGNPHRVSAAAGCVKSVGGFYVLQRRTISCIRRANSRH